jgi:hypothetical protein
MSTAYVREYLAADSIPNLALCVAAFPLRSTAPKTESAVYLAECLVGPDTGLTPPTSAPGLACSGRQGSALRCGLLQSVRAATAWLSYDGGLGRRSGALSALLWSLRVVCRQSQWPASECYTSTPSGHHCETEWFLGLLTSISLSMIWSKSRRCAASIQCSLLDSKRDCGGVNA